MGAPKPPSPGKSIPDALRQLRVSDLQGEHLDELGSLLSLLGSEAIELSEERDLSFLAELYLVEQMKGKAANKDAMKRIEAIAISASGAAALVFSPQLLDERASTSREQSKAAEIIKRKLSHSFQKTQDSFKEGLMKLKKKGSGLKEKMDAHAEARMRAELWCFLSPFAGKDYISPKLTRKLFRKGLLFSIEGGKCAPNQNPESVPGEYRNRVKTWSEGYSNSSVCAMGREELKLAHCKIKLLKRLHKKFNISTMLFPLTTQKDDLVSICRQISEQKISRLFMADPRNYQEALHLIGYSGNLDRLSDIFINPSYREQMHTLLGKFNYNPHDVSSPNICRSYFRCLAKASKETMDKLLEAETLAAILDLYHKRNSAALGLVESFASVDNRFLFGLLHSEKALVPLLKASMTENVKGFLKWSASHQGASLSSQDAEFLHDFVLPCGLGKFWEMADALPQDEFGKVLSCSAEIRRLTKTNTTLANAYFGCVAKTRDAQALTSQEFLDFFGRAVSIGTGTDYLNSIMAHGTEFLASKEFYSICDRLVGAVPQYIDAILSSNDLGNLRRADFIDALDKIRRAPGHPAAALLELVKSMKSAKEVAELATRQDYIDFIANDNDAQVVYARNKDFFYAHAQAIIMTGRHNFLLGDPFVQLAKAGTDRTFLSLVALPKQPKSAFFDHAYQSMARIGSLFPDKEQRKEAASCFEKALSAAFKENKAVFNGNITDASEKALSTLQKLSSSRAEDKKNHLLTGFSFFLQRLDPDKPILAQLGSFEGCITRINSLPATTDSKVQEMFKSLAYNTNFETFQHASANFLSTLEELNRLCTNPEQFSRCAVLLEPFIHSESINVRHNEYGALKTAKFISESESSLSKQSVEPREFCTRLGWILNEGQSKPELSETLMQSLCASGLQGEIVDILVSSYRSSNSSQAGKMRRDALLSSRVPQRLESLFMDFGSTAYRAQVIQQLVSNPAFEPLKIGLLMGKGSLDLGCAQTLSSLFSELEKRRAQDAFVQRAVSKLGSTPINENALSSLAKITLNAIPLYEAVGWKDTCHFDLCMHLSSLQLLSPVGQKERFYRVARELSALGRIPTDLAVLSTLLIVACPSHGSIAHFEKIVHSLNRQRAIETISQYQAMSALFEIFAARQGVSPQAIESACDALEKLRNERKEEQITPELARLWLSNLVMELPVGDPAIFRILKALSDRDKQTGDRSIMNLLARKDLSDSHRFRYFARLLIKTEYLQKGVAKYLNSDADIAVMRQIVAQNRSEFSTVMNTLSDMKEYPLAKNKEDVFSGIRELGSLTPKVYQKYLELKKSKRAGYVRRITQLKRVFFRNEPASKYLSNEEKELLAELVYLAYKPPNMSFNTVRDLLGKVPDKTQDLENYKFPQEGYEFFMGRKGYRLREGETVSLDLNGLKSLLSSTALPSEFGEILAKKVARAATEYTDGEVATVLGKLYDNFVSSFLSSYLDIGSDDQCHSFLSGFADILGLYFKDNFPTRLAEYLGANPQVSGRITKTWSSEARRATIEKQLGRAGAIDWRSAVSPKSGMVPLLTDLFRDKALKGRIGKIRKELKKFEPDIGKIGGEKAFRAYLSKNSASFFAKASAGICTAADVGLFTRKDHFHINVVEDDATVRANIQAYIINIDGGEALLLRGFNPNIDFEQRISPKSFCEGVLEIAKKFVEENSFNGLYLTSNEEGYHALSNRGQISSYLESRYVREDKARAYRMSIASEKSIDTIYRAI